MDKGTNAMKMLRGEDVALKLGYVGVKLRSQKDIQDNVNVQQALKNEREFFARHPIYSSNPGDLFCTSVLTTKLTNILYRHIRSFLPELMREIDKRASGIQERLVKLGPGLPTEDKVAYSSLF
jgi:replication fork clamp-binding protein CrfC